MEKKQLARRLANRTEVINFCKNILFNEIPNYELSSNGEYNKEFQEAVKDILDKELLVQNLGNKQDTTLDSELNRVEEYREDDAREMLRDTIAHECLQKRRLPENEVCLGKGGMLPNVEVKDEKQLYILIGLPASGKSTISEKLADETGSVYLDCDIVKRKLPEFDADTRGATLVHLESNYILRPEIDLNMGKVPKYNIMVNCFQNHSNIVYNMIGDNYDWLKLMIDLGKNNGYKVHLLLVELDRIKCVKRAYARYKKTNRYISLPVIFDEYSNNPTSTFYKAIVNKLVDSYAHIDNDVEKGAPKKIVLNNFANSDIIKKIANII